MIHRVHVDIETFSELSIKDTNSIVYASHPSTEILCMAYAFDDELPRIWVPSMGPFPDRVYKAAEDPDYIFVAHNAAFEQAIWNHLIAVTPEADNWVCGQLPPEKWECTAARASYINMPRALAKVGKLLGLPPSMLKDADRKKSMDDVVKIKRGKRCTDPNKLWDTYLYCISEGTPVLTKNGPVPIEHVRVNDEIWDGVGWVKHEGVIRKGHKRVIESFGVYVTPDHSMLTDQGWSPAQNCNNKTPENSRYEKAIETGGQALQAWYDTTSSLPQLDIDEATVSQPESSRLYEIWEAWYFRMPTLAREFREILEGYGCDLLRGCDDRSDRQRSRVLPNELPVGDEQTAESQQAYQSDSGLAVRENDSDRAIREDRHKSRYIKKTSQPWGYRPEVGPTYRREPTTEASTYDLLNCGPRNQFVVVGNEGPVIVHNCMQDVVAEQAIDKATLPLPAAERRLWLIDQKINHRGMPIDVDLCRGACKIIEESARRANDMLYDLTWGAIDSTNQRERIHDYIAQQGFALPDLQEGTVAEALEGDLSENVRKVLQARADNGSAAVKKFKAALNHVCLDNRCRNQYIYYAAGPGRWASAGVQFQNLKRLIEGFEPTPETLAAATSGDIDELAKHGDPIKLLSYMVRSIACAKDGHVLVGPDLKSIEYITLHWLANSTQAVEDFRSGAKVYEKFAAERIYHCDISEIQNPSEQRTVAKYAVLGLGFCMGGKRFMEQTQEQGGIVLERTFCDDVVTAYREAYPDVVDLWKQLEMAALSCVQYGQPVFGDKWEWRMWRDCLTLKIPSGRRLFYRNPRIIKDPKWGSNVIEYDSGKGTRCLTKPIMVENLVQATARDFLREGLFRLDEQGINIVGTTHDSVYVECLEHEADEMVEILNVALETPPSWAPDIPLVAETSYTKRMH